VYQLRITRARMPAGELTRVNGLLVASSGLARAEGPAAIEINVPVEAPLNFIFRSRFATPKRRFS
jgi:hypothetical protein